MLDLTGKLTFPQKKLLSKGLSFVPKNLGAVHPETHWDAFQLKIRDKLNPVREKYADAARARFPTPQVAKNYKVKFQQKHQTIADFLVTAGETLFGNVRNSLSEESSDNLKEEERRALHELKTDRSLVIKPADKGRMVVVMARERYIQEGLKQLSDTNTYVEIPHSLKVSEERRDWALVMTSQNNSENIGIISIMAK